MALEEQQPAPRRRLVDLIVFGAIAVWLVADLIEDATKASTVHLGIEVAASAFALIAAARVWRRFTEERRAAHADMEELRGRLHEVAKDAERWRAEAHDALAGLGAAIERQCDHWGLTDAERGVALLLLKGLSMKEIAQVRGTAERTARQQALAVYRKAKLAGRAELSAFFLEDLLLPSSAGQKS